MTQAKKDSSRSGSVVNEWRRKLRYVTPAELRRRAKILGQHARLRTTRPAYQSTSINVYHCCVQRTGSQWIRNMLADPRVFKYSGLRQAHPNELWPGVGWKDLTDRHSDVGFPPGRIVSPLYIDFPGYQSFPKPERYRTFAIVRDPRDIVVSWYFSSRYSHRLRGKEHPISEVRRNLDLLSEGDGLQYAIEYLAGTGLFEALRSWVSPARHQTENMVVRYEDLIGPDQLELFSSLFSHCDIRLPDEVLRALLADHSFESMSGRTRGDENQFAHLRKGVAGDWRNHFDDQVAAKFQGVTGDLVMELGYDAR